MGFPDRDVELALHRRIIDGDPTASADIFMALIQPMVMNLCADLGCDPEEAHDSAIDALFAYFARPDRFDPGAAKLGTYLQSIAWYKAVDRLRGRRTRDHFEENSSLPVELASSDPKEEMERIVEVDDLWPRVKDSFPRSQDRRALLLILDGERSTDALASALELPQMSSRDRQKEVKRHRDRLLKVLERLGKRLRDERARLASQSCPKEP